MGQARETHSKHWYSELITRRLQLKYFTWVRKERLILSTGILHLLQISRLKQFNLDKVKETPMPSMVFIVSYQQIATHSEHALAFRAQEHQIATILLIVNQVREQAFFEH
jgi:hypothetical protein